MKVSRIYVLSLCLLSSCVIDSFVPVFTLSNNSNKKIRVYYSNNENIDTIFLKKKYTIIFPHTADSRVEGDVRYNKKTYISDTSKKLYQFIFDNDTIQNLEGQENMEIIAHKAFLERRIIDIRRITPKDTIYFEGDLRN